MWTLVLSRSARCWPRSRDRWRSSFSARSSKARRRDLPLAFGIVRDEFPREKVAGSIGLLSAILGVGGGMGIVLRGLIVEHLNYHWLFWLPLIPTVFAALATWRFIRRRVAGRKLPGRINWLAAVLMTIGMSIVLIAISNHDMGLGIDEDAWPARRRHRRLLWPGSRSEVRSSNPLVDIGMMRIRGCLEHQRVRVPARRPGCTRSFIAHSPQIAQLPKQHRLRLWRLRRPSRACYPVAIDDRDDGFWASYAGADLPPASARSARRCLAGTAFGPRSFALLARRAQPIPHDLLIAAGLLRRRQSASPLAALGNLIVQAVSPHQTGVASGMNTVMRTLGGALGGPAGRRRSSPGTPLTGCQQSRGSPRPS